MSIEESVTAAPRALAFITHESTPETSAANGGDVVSAASAAAASVPASLPAPAARKKTSLSAPAKKGYMPTNVQPAPGAKPAAARAPHVSLIATTAHDAARAGSGSGAHVAARAQTRGAPDQPPPALHVLFRVPLTATDPTGQTSLHMSPARGVEAFAALPTGPNGRPHTLFTSAGTAPLPPIGGQSSLYLFSSDAVIAVRPDSESPFATLPRNATISKMKPLKVNVDVTGPFVAYGQFILRFEPIFAHHSLRDVDVHMENTVSETVDPAGATHGLAVAGTPGIAAPVELELRPLTAIVTERAGLSAYDEYMPPTYVGHEVKGTLFHLGKQQGPFIPQLVVLP